MEADRQLLPAGRMSSAFQAAIPPARSARKSKIAVYRGAHNALATALPSIEKLDARLRIIRLFISVQDRNCKGYLNWDDLGNREGQSNHAQGNRPRIECSAVGDGPGGHGKSPRRAAGARAGRTSDLSRSLCAEHSPDNHKHGCLGGLRGRRRFFTWLHWNEAAQQFSQEGATIWSQPDATVIDVIHP